MERTNASTIGVALSALGVALVIDRHYNIDLTIALPIIFISTGLYVALVPLRIKENKPIIITKSKAVERKENRFGATLKLIGTLILGLVIALFFAYQLRGYIMLAIFLFVGMFINELFKKWR